MSLVEALLRKVLKGSLSLSKDFDEEFEDDERDDASVWDVFSTIDRRLVFSSWCWFDSWERMEVWDGDVGRELRMFVECRVFTVGRNGDTSIEDVSMVSMS